jgi:hypothetical protein
MKKYLKMIAISMVMVIALNNCKKDDNVVPKNYLAAIGNQTWWGTFTYTGQNAEYFSVHFNANNTLMWSQSLGDYPGKWTIDGKALTMNFTNGTQIRADITDDNKLTNIVANTKFYIVNSGQQVASTFIVLDNTMWEGTTKIMGSSDPLAATFRPNLAATIDNVEYEYSKSASGMAIRATSNNTKLTFFGVLTSGTEMRGTDSNSSDWQLTKKN